MIALDNFLSLLVTLGIYGSLLLATDPFDSYYYLLIPTDHFCSLLIPLIPTFFDPYWPLSITFGHYWYLLISILFAFNHYTDPFRTLLITMDHYDRHYGSFIYQNKKRLSQQLLLMKTKMKKKIIKFSEFFSSFVEGCQKWHLNI